MSQEDRKALYELRGVISHVVDYEKLKAAWLATLYNPNAPGLVEEFVKVRDHFFMWYYKLDKAGASIYQDKFKAIDSHFEDNLRAENWWFWLQYKARSIFHLKAPVK